MPKHLDELKTDRFNIEFCRILCCIESLTSQYTSSSKQLSSAGSPHIGSFRINPANIKRKKNWHSENLQKKLRICEN